MEYAILIEGEEFLVRPEEIGLREIKKGIDVPMFIQSEEGHTYVHCGLLVMEQFLHQKGIIFCFEKTDAEPPQDNNIVGICPEVKEADERFKSQMRGILLRIKRDQRE